MLFRKNKKISLWRRIKRFFLSLILLTILLLVACLFIPMTWVNAVLKHTTDIELVTVSGDIRSASWQAIKIKGQDYPLACHYQPQSLSLSGIHYQLDCQTPLTVQATLSLNWLGHVHVSDAHIQGELRSANDWFAFAGLPSTINGMLDLHIARATVKTIKARQLTYLDITGSLKPLCIFSQTHLIAGRTPYDCLNQLAIETKEKSASADKPIIVTVNTLDDSETIQLNSRVELYGNRYQAELALSGKPIRKIAKQLRYIAKERQLNTFVMHFKGDFL